MTRYKENKTMTQAISKEDHHQDYPFAQELITDTQGHILKVVINFNDYERIIEAIEDEGLYRAMMEVKNETPLTFEQALAELDKQ